MSATYVQLIRKLYSVNMFNAVKIGLENMNKLDRLLGYPLAEIPIVHVTGTNGKGSVCFKVASALSASGIKTGLFLSPHIASFKERIQVDHTLLSDEDVETILPRIFELCEQNQIPATFFEITTALAFAKFQRAGCEAVVLEVGMGGRLDATNVVNPALSVITAVQFDHMKILGDTIEKIAFEKAGIIKKNKPVIVGPGCPMDIIKDKAIEVNAPLFVPRDILSHEESNYNPQSPTDNDTELLNIDIAQAAMKLLKQQQSPSIFSKKIDLEKIKQDRILWKRPPCRFEEYIVSANDSTEDKSTMIIMDIAHNVDAIKALIKKVSDRYPQKKIRAVLGMSSDKDVSGCVPLVLDLVNQQEDNLYCTQAPLPRALSSHDLRKLFASQHGTSAAVVSTSHQNDGGIRDCVRKALLDSFQLSNASTSFSFTKFNSYNDPVPSNVDSIVIVFGTVFIMADARSEIGIIEPRDENDASSSGKDIYNYKDVKTEEKK